MVKGLAISDQNCWMGTTTKVICKEQLRIFEFKKVCYLGIYRPHILRCRAWLEENIIHGRSLIAYGLKICCKILQVHLQVTKGKLLQI